MEAVKKPRRKQKKARELSSPQSNRSPAVSSSFTHVSSNDQRFVKADSEKNFCSEEASTSKEALDSIHTELSKTFGEANLENPSTILSRSEDENERPFNLTNSKEKLYPVINEYAMSKSTDTELPLNVVDSSLVTSDEIMDSDFSSHAQLVGHSKASITFSDELMSEDQLLYFYHNILYEKAEDFVDYFIESECNGNYELSNYLKRYKLACQELLESRTEVEKCETLIRECIPYIWKECRHSSEQTGECGDQRQAYAKLEYTTAELQPDKLNDLSELLKKDSKLQFDNVFCSDVQAKSLVLQIQWHIDDLKSAFMSEFNVGPNASSKLLCETDNNSIRLEIRRALSDLFYCLRYPQLPAAFVKSVTDWICELCAVLLKAGTCVDLQFILCHVLRLPRKNSDWTAALIQTYLKELNPSDQLVIDNFLALLSLLLSPIKRREEFLNGILSSEEEDHSWNIVSENLVEDDISLTAIDETDLISFLNQFSIETLFIKAVTYFGYVNRLNPLSEILSLTAFQLVLMKIFDNGLNTYGEDKFRELCKQIGYMLQKSVKLVSEFWKVRRDLLRDEDRSIAQREFDRIVLQAVYYIVSKKSLGLCQFLVDLPYETVSECCKNKCQLLLRKKNVVTPSQLYQIPFDVLLEELKSENLLDCLYSLSKDDSNYLIVALTSVISVSESHIHWFLTELFNICFIDECTRDDFYKVGAEAIAIVLDKQPAMLGRILSLIDRNIDALDQYALEILSAASLSRCVVTVNDVGSICGKWLINRTPEHPASRIARRVLSSLNWGFDCNKKLWLDVAVHSECAETLVKGHMVQCKHTNGLMAKSLHKVTKLVLKVPDYEFQFETFCWDILLKLKLPVQTTSTSPPTDLAAYYIYIMQYYLNSPDGFFSKGQYFWSELVASGCYRAASVIIAELLSKFPECIENALRSENFVEIFDRLLHSDQSAYAIQLISGSDNFPGPTIRFLESIIAHSLTKSYSLPLLNAWVKLLCSAKSVVWTGDSVVLYLLGFISEFCFLKSSEAFSYLTAILQQLHNLSFQQWKISNGKGLLGWLTNDRYLPTAITSSAMGVSPWATYTLLIAEERSFSTFYEAFYASLTKHPKDSVEQCQKKASTKSHVPLCVENLHFVRWLQFACIDSVGRHSCFPLICQNIASRLFYRRSVSNSVACFANQYFATECAKPLFEKLLKTVLPRLEVQVAKDTSSDVSLLYKAFGQWLNNVELREPQFTAFNKLLLGNLVQELICDGKSDWKKYINGQQPLSRLYEIVKIYTSVRHWGIVSLYSQSLGTANSNNPTLVDFFDSLKIMDHVVPFPHVPIHNNLPKKLLLSAENICNVDYCLSLFGKQLQNLGSITRKYVEAKDFVEACDGSYIKHFSNLYASQTISIPLVFTCNSFGNRCLKPLNTTMSLCVMQSQAKVETLLERNRQERIKALTNLTIQFLDSSAKICAHLEFITNALTTHSNKKESFLYGDRLKASGRALFYHLISTATAFDMIFIAAANTFAYILNNLGEVFIAYQASEQYRLMNVSLNCSHLIHLTAAYFTPECLPSQQLVEVYTALSQAIKVPATSSLALKLLSRLDIKNAGERLPAHLFSGLMPLAFENLISLNEDVSSVFYNLCFDHFMHALFYRFPTNFISGITLILSACDSNSVPSSVFENLVRNLGADKIDDQTFKPIFVVGAEVACMACEAITNQLVKSHLELGTKLYIVWSKYLNEICILSEFFIYKSASASFDSKLSINRIKEELQNSFTRSTRLFGPLIEPSGPGNAPWNLKDFETAAFVVDRFTSVLRRLHLLYDLSLPPGSENTAALLCNYCGNHLCLADNRFAYVYELLASLLKSCIESRLMSIPWNTFLPNLTHLAVIERVLKDSLLTCGPLFTQILVRLPWHLIIKNVYLQPADVISAFFGLLLSVVARSASCSNNYAKCPASLSKVFETLSCCDWSLLKINDLKATSMFIAEAFPPSCLCDQNEVFVSFFTMYRKISFYSTILSGSIAVAEEYERQAIYLRTQLILMNRSDSNLEWKTNYYMDQVVAVNAIVTARGDFSKLPCCLAAELTACWSFITDVEFGEALVNGLCYWLLKNSESQLVLLTMNTVINSLCVSQVITGLKVLEECIVSFFQRSLTSKWEVIVDWAIIPESCEQHLLSTPCPDKPTKLLLLTVNVYLLQRLKSCSSPEQETIILKKLFDYMTHIEPKNVDNEAAFIVLVDKLQNLVLRQYNYNLCSGSKYLTSYLEFLEKIYADENSSFFAKLLVKKHQFSNRLQLVAQILKLYVTQQTVSVDRPLREKENAPILNSRIQAYKDLGSVKHYASYKKMLSQIEPFFLQFRKYHIGHLNELFALMVRSLYVEKYATSMYQQ